jgi:hypothetical protein
MTVICITLRNDNDRALARYTLRGTWVNVETACAFKILTRFRVPGNAEHRQR